MPLYTNNEAAFCVSLYLLAEIWLNIYSHYTAMQYVMLMLMLYNALLWCCVHAMSPSHAYHWTELQDLRPCHCVGLHLYMLRYIHYSITYSIIVSYY